VKNNLSRRRSIAYVSSMGTTQLHLRSPWIMAFWSLMFPGLGHLLLSKYLRGYLLLAWEIVINIQAHVNEAMFFSFIGKYEIAKNLLDIRWLLLYVPMYLFAIGDSYRTCVDINNNYILAARDETEFNIFKMNAIEINSLDKKSPWAAAAWSLLMPGTGQLAIHRIASAFFILIWWVIIVYYSNLLPAIHYTFIGDFSQATSAINIQWFLNIPSIYFFAIYDAYINTVEINKLFDWEQSKFLNRDYQYEFFKMPSK